MSKKLSSQQGAEKIQTNRHQNQEPESQEPLDSLSGSTQRQYERSNSMSSNESEMNHFENDNKGQLIEYFRDAADKWKSKFRSCAQKVELLKDKLRKARKQLEQYQSRSERESCEQGDEKPRKKKLIKKNKN